MDKEESQPLETDDEMIRNGKNVYELLHTWATSRTRLVFSAGVYGFNVEGTLRPIKEPEDESWGIFEASFIFMSKTREITAHVLMMPGMKILTKPSGEVRAVEFGPKGAESCTLRSVERCRPHPDDVKTVLAQLSAWAERKMKVWVHLDFAFSGLAQYCNVEKVTDQSFALTEDGCSHTIFAIPAFGSRASIENLEGITTVRLTSEDRRSELLIFEPGADKGNPMERMITHMIQ